MYIVTATLEARRRVKSGSTLPVELRDPLSRRQAIVAGRDSGTRTRGHLADHGGLRGHSVDPDTYPWRVVGGFLANPACGLLATWDVYGADGLRYGRFVEGQRHPSDMDACALAHRRAKSLKLQFPAGRADEDEGNYGGTCQEFLERCEGHRVTLRKHGQERHTGTLHRSPAPGWATLRTDQAHVTFDLKVAKNPDIYPLFEVEFNPYA